MECKFFKQGSCKNGTACKFTHAATAPPAQITTTTVTVVVQVGPAQAAAAALPPNSNASTGAKIKKKTGEQTGVGKKPGKPKVPQDSGAKSQPKPQQGAPKQGKAPKQPKEGNNAQPNRAKEGKSKQPKEETKQSQEANKAKSNGAKEAKSKQPKQPNKQPSEQKQPKEANKPKQAKQPQPNDKQSKASRQLQAPVKAVSAVYAQQRRHTEFFFRNRRGELGYHYLGLDGCWTTDNVSFGSNAVVAGDIAAVFEPQRNHSAVFWAGPHLSYAYLGPSGWAVDSASFAVAGPVYHVAAVYEPQRGHSAVFAATRDGPLHYFYVKNGTWQHDAASFAAHPVQGAISAVFEPQRNHVAVSYRGVDGLLHYWYVPPGSGWAHDGTSFQTHPVGPKSNIVSVFETQRNHTAIIYAGLDGNIRYWYVVQGRGWTCDFKTFAVAPAAANGALDAVFEYPRQHTAIIYSGVDGRVHYWYVAPAVGWLHDAQFTEQAPVWTVSAVLAPHRNHTEFVTNDFQHPLQYWYVPPGSPWSLDNSSLVV